MVWQKALPIAHGIGHARFRGTGGETALDYIVRCDDDWLTLGADATGLQTTAELDGDHYVLTARSGSARRPRSPIWPS